VWCGGCKKAKSAVDAVDSMESVVGQCDGKSLVHISMRPERRQPTQIGSRSQISQGQAQGLMRERMALGPIAREKQGHCADEPGCRVREPWSDDPPLKGRGQSALAFNLTFAG
jgi:hypothetical protein